MYWLEQKKVTKDFKQTIYYETRSVEIQCLMVWPLQSVS